MGIWLVMEMAGSERPFSIRKTTVIGRDVRSDVRIAVPSVSMRHCELTLEESGLHLTDLGSEAGTLHNGSRVREAWLTDADRLTVGPVTFRVRVTEEQEEQVLSTDRDLLEAAG